MTDHANQLQDSTVVIIGGSSGMGLATAQLCAGLGAQVTISSRSEPKLKSAATQIGHGVRTAAADFTDLASMARLFAAFDHIDHVFLSAGTVTSGRIIDSPVDHLKSAIDERIWGPIYMVQSVVPKMNAGSSITFMSGQFSTTPSTEDSIMAVALAAVEMLTKVLALELGPIRVNAVAPGIIDTPLLGEDRQEAESYGASLPVGRMGLAAEVAQAVVMLMTNGFITGEVLHIDGGGRFV